MRIIPRPYTGSATDFDCYISIHKINIIQLFLVTVWLVTLFVCFELTVGLRLAWLSRPLWPYSLDQSIVYLDGCLLSFGREQLNSRRIIFQGGSFRTIHGDTFAREGSFHTLYRKGTTLYGGIGYFVTPTLLFNLLTDTVICQIGVGVW